MNSIKSQPPVICILPHLEGLGGPASFQRRLIAGLQQRGVGVSYNPADPAVTAILITGGTTRLLEVWRARQRGVRIVQRLNGMNWMHRRRPTPPRDFWRAERSNWLLSSIRRWLADRIVYQSEFSRGWWQTVYGATSARGSVVYNGVDLNICTPIGAHERPLDHIRVLLVEGHLAESNQEGLRNALRLVQLLNEGSALPVRLQVVGDVTPSLQARYQAEAGAWIDWRGAVSGEQIPLLDRSAHLFFSADLNAACPNSVIEALACGLPVAAFATGSLPELVDSDAGRIVPYGNNYWKLEEPLIEPLAVAARQILAEPERFRRAARQQAEEKFGLDGMVKGYLEALVE
jgi:glycosyltransferase involved in cell wall biosynthesis